MDELLKGLIALFAGLLGTYGGARMAMRQTKHERSHERRLEWHLAALRTMHEIEAALRRSHPDRLERVPEWAEARERFRWIVGEAPAFMGRDAAFKLVQQEVGLMKAEDRTRAALVDGEPLPRMIEWVAGEMIEVAQARMLIIEGLTRLMPQEADTPWYSLRRFRRRVSRHKQKEAGA